MAPGARRRRLGAEPGHRPRPPLRRQPLPRPEGEGSFVDAASGTAFDLFGRGAGGDLDGRRLVAVEHVDTFWFAWAAYRPESRIVPADASSSGRPGFVCGRVQYDVPECTPVPREAPPGR